MVAVLCNIAIFDNISLPLAGQRRDCHAPSRFLLVAHFYAALVPQHEYDKKVG